MTTNTIRLHRVLRTTPEKIYRAFLDPDAMARWLPPNGFTAKVLQMDARIGGSYRMSFTNFATGYVHAFGGTRSSAHRASLPLLVTVQTALPALLGQRPVVVLNAATQTLI